jgi:hypothetical protein
MMGADFGPCCVRTNSDPQSLKILFLGLPNSGKSTFRNHLLIQYGFGLSNLANYKSLIHRTILKSMKQIILKMNAQKLDLYHKLENENSKKTVLTQEIEDFMSPELSDAIKSLWNDPNLRIFAENAMIDFLESLQ